MRDITDLMNSYRECSRNLWNVYFSAKDYWSESTCAYGSIRKLLFQTLVLDELLYDDSLEPPPPPVLRIVPRWSVILINRPSEDGNGYWDQEKDLAVGETDIQLEFVDYFDWSEYPLREFHFYRCKILKFPSHVEYEGRQALIEVLNCRVFHDEEAESVQNT